MLAGLLHGADAGPAQPPKPKWESSASVGFTLTKGNSDTVLFTANAATQKKWERDELGFGVDGTYGENNSVKNAESAHAFGQYNRLISSRAFGMVRVDGLHDAVASVDYRVAVGPGGGYYFIKTTNTWLRGEVGPGFVEEKVGGQTRNYLTLRLAERFEEKLTSRLRLWQSLEILPQVDRFQNYVLNGEIGIESELVKRLSLRVFLLDTYRSEPAAGRKRNDVKLVSALAYSF